MTHTTKPMSSFALRALLASLALSAFGCSRGESSAESENVVTVEQSLVPVMKGYTAVGVGATHTCGLTTSGTLSCFGGNMNKQAETPTGTFVALSANSYGNCAIRADKSILCWGEEGAYSGPPSGTFSAVARSDYHACALETDGTIVCWGQDSFGEATPPAGTFKAIATGMEFTCGIKADDTVVCWGYDGNGAVSDAPTGTFSRIAVSLKYACAVGTDASIHCWGLLPGSISVPNTPDYTEVAVSQTELCALDKSGAAYCSGSNGWSTPTVQGLTSLATGDNHACAIDDGGKLICWGGAGSSGELVETSGVYQSVAMGITHSCALDAAGQVSCWGDNVAGETNPQTGTFTSLVVGDNHSCAIDTSSSAAVCWGGAVAAPGQYTQLSSNANFTCGVKVDQTLACWGQDVYGETSPPPGAFKSVAVGLYHACAIKTDDTVTCWGNNPYGQTTPLSGTFTKIVSGYNHVCGLRENGVAECWGLALGPEYVAPSGTFTDIAAAGNSSCALSTQGKPVCWGDMKDTPYIPPTPALSKLVLDAYRNSCGISVDGELICWGSLARNLSRFKLSFPSELPSFTAYEAVNYAIPVSGGKAPYTFSIDSGALPKGLTMSSAGVIKGTPAEANGSGSYIVLRVTDATGASDTKQFSVYTGTNYADLLLESGSGQSALVDEAFELPLVAQAAGEGGGVSGITVHFTGPNMAFSSATAVTDTNGFASVIATPIGSAGPRKVWATMSGDGTAIQFNLTALAHDTSLILASKAEAKQGEIVLLTATLDVDGAAAGKVNFFVDDELRCAGNVKDAVASCKVLLDSEGEHTLSAKYLGDGRNKPSEAQPVIVNVTYDEDYLSNTGGAPGLGGAAAGTGGSSDGTGATSSSGGTSSTGGANNDPDAMAGSSNDDSNNGSDSSGCSFDPTASTAPSSAALMLALAALTRLRRRRAA